MATYAVELTAPKGHEIPALLSELGDFLVRQPHGSLGWFDAMVAAPIAREWSKEHGPRLQKAGFAFLHLPDGSDLALLRVGGSRPVVLLGSEGESRALGDSLEEFLLAWAAGATGVDELDDEACTGRPALAAWIKQRGIKPAKSKSRFDFEVWLDGGKPDQGRPEATAAPARRETAIMKKLGPRLRQAASLVGLRADDPRVEEFVTRTLKKKLPPAGSARNASAWVEAPKAGLNLLFSYDVLNDAYPRIPQTRSTFVPYLSRIDVAAALGEDILEVPWSASADEARRKLGTPTEMRGLTMSDVEGDIPAWTFVLDEGAEVLLDLQVRRQLRVSIELGHARALEQFPDHSLGVFVGWAARRGLLDEPRFRGHETLLAEVKQQQRPGSDLVRAAMGRGLWDDHLVDEKGLRRFAYLWFHNLKGAWITADFKEVFGKRPGPHGHDEPKLDDDSWAAVEKASKILDERFAPWLGKKG